MKTRVYDGFVKVDKVDTPVGPREVVFATNSVAFLVYNKDRDELLFATQDRAPMMRPDNPRGTILEVGAGRFDTTIGVKGLVVKELKEELGVTATEAEVQVLNGEIPLALSPGVLTERQYLAYVEVTSDRIDPAKRLYGERKEGEAIARRFIPVREISQTPIYDMKTWVLLQWFRARHAAAKPCRG
jgi:8-oxo-dGTP pyrophosphatase MutT (NUDIX family)